jgi:hypothetical protein
MTNPQKAKGDRSELEAARLLQNHLGWNVRRKLGAGRADDTGDLWVAEMPDLVIQVKNYRDVARAVREARDGADAQAVNLESPLRFGMVRHPGGRWTCVASVEAMAVWIREALA